MKKASNLVPTSFARGVVYLVGIAALAVCFILLPELAREEATGKPNPELIYAFLGTAYILATPFFIALYQTLKLLRNIDEKKAFSQQSIKALKNIKYCALVFSLMFAVAVIVGVTTLRMMNPEEDAPPFFLFGFIVTSVSIIITVFIAVLQRLLVDAVALKSENDLIV